MENIPFFDYIYYILIILLIILAIEIVFLLTFKFKNGVSYKFVKKIPLEKIHIIPHPYIPYIYKKHAKISEVSWNFPNCKNYLFPSLKTNNFQFPLCLMLVPVTLVQKLPLFPARIIILFFDFAIGSGSGVIS